MALVKCLNERNRSVSRIAENHTTLFAALISFSLHLSFSVALPTRVHLFLLHCHGLAPLLEVHFSPVDTESWCRYAVWWVERVTTIRRVA